MTIITINKNGCSHMKTFNFMPTMPQILKLLHYARRKNLRAYIETNKGTYYLNGVKLAKMG